MDMKKYLEENYKEELKGLLKTKEVRNPTRFFEEFRKEVKEDDR